MIDNKKLDIHAVLFDMDGVLVDSERIMNKSAVIALKKWGVNARSEDFTPFIGAGEVAYLGGVSLMYGVEYDPEMTKEAYTVYGRLISEGESIAFPYSSRVVRYLKSRGIKTAVCTSADRMKLAFNLKALGLHDEFDALITGEDIVHNKPSPDIYLRGAEVLGVSPEHCLVCEDALNGIRAAVAANMPSLGITTSFPEDKLTECGATLVAPTIEKLEEIL